MADEQLISEYIDLGAVTGQTDAFLAQIKRLDEAYASISSKSISLGGINGSAQQSAEIQQLQADILKLKLAKEQLILTAKEEQKTDRDGADAKKAAAQAAKDEATTAKQSANDKKAAAQAARDSAKADAEAAKAATVAAKAQADQNNLLKVLTKQYNEAQVAAFTLAKSQGTESAAFKIAAADASALKDRILELKLATNDTSSSVGRYNEGIKGVNVVNASAINSTGGLVAGVSKFYGFLRVAANIIPGLGISGIFLAGFEAIKLAANALGFFDSEGDKAAAALEKQSKAAQELIDNYRNLHEIVDTASGNSQGQVVEVEALANAVTDQTLSYKERNNALNELKTINKAYFGDLTVETASLELLTKRVNEYIQSLVNQAVIKELEGDIGKVTVAYNRQETQVRKTVDAINAQRDAINASRNPIVTSQGFDNLAKLNGELRDQVKILNPLKDQYAQLSDEIFAATKAGLEFIKPKGGGSEGENTRLKTFDAKQDDSDAKRFIELQKQVSQALSVELEMRISLRQAAYGQEYNLLVEAADRERKVAQDAANDVFNDPKANGNQRVNAQRKLVADLETIDNKFHADELGLEESFQFDFDTIVGSARQKRFDDEKRDNDAAIAQFKIEEDARLKAAAEAVKKRNEQQNVNQDFDLISLNKRFEDGFISEKEYLEKKFELEKYYSNKTTQNTLADLSKLIKQQQSQGIDTTATQLQIADIKKKIDDDLTQHLLDNRQKLQDKEKEVSLAVLNGAAQLVDDTFDNRKNQIQDQIDILEKQKQKEIDVVNASVASAQDKAAQIAIINARAEAQQQDLEKRQRDQDVKKAEFDKLIAIAQIAINTEQAVSAIEVKAVQARAEAALLAANPATASYAGIAAASAVAIASQIPLVIAQGVIAAALVAAKPVPRYFRGTENHPGGAFIGGDGGKSEYVLLPSGEGFKTTNVPTLYDAPAGTRVFPDANNLPDEILRMALQQAPQAFNVDPMGNLVQSMSREISHLRAAVMQKQENHFHWSNGELQRSHKKGEQWTRYKNGLI
jgi:hypothetical protein